MSRRVYDGIWHITWASPYSQPPDGRPRTLAMARVLDWRKTGDKRPPEDLVALKLANPGYGLCWAWELPVGHKPRRWSKEARARNRVRRLRRRMEAQYPLFADQFVQDALDANPAYYRAEDPSYDVGRDE